MKALIAFPPGANPSYRPLGPAVLESFIRKEAPEILTESLDLNNLWWNHLAEREPEGPVARWRAFVTNAGLFFDRGRYSSMLSTRAAAHELFNRSLEELGTWLETPETLQPLPSSLLKELLFLMERRIAEVKPDLLLVSTLYLRQLPAAVGLSRLAKNLNAPVRTIMGGAALSALDIEELMNAAPWIDCAVTGEGELPLLDILRGAAEERVPGLFYRTAEGAVCRSREDKPCPVETTRLPPPVFRAEDPRSPYYLPETVLPVAFSRGCKWRACRFCAHNGSFDRYRPKAAADFVNELEILVKETGCRHFYFVDQYIDGKDLSEIAGEIIRRNLGIHYHYMGRTTGSDYSPAVFALLASSGCRWVSWGVESGSLRLLRTAAKGTEPSVTLRVLKESFEAGINNLAMMIFGLPGSDDQALDETFDFIEEMAPTVSAMTESSFVLYRTTPFGRHPKKYGLIPGNRQLLFTVEGRPVHSDRIDFRETGSDGSPRGPRGPEEVSRWQRRKQWMFPDQFFAQLPAEHYLLFAALPFAGKTPEFNPETPDAA